jgi:hypothetical protein
MGWSLCLTRALLSNQLGELAEMMLMVKVYAVGIGNSEALWGQPAV